MKHLSGEKTGLKADQLINSGILFFLIFSSLSYCQIPINGFCSLKSSDIPSGFKSIISSDINFDNNDELIFYSPELKSLGILFDNSDNDDELREFQIGSEISQLRQLRDKEDSTRLFVAIERKLRKISLLSITLDSIKEQIGEITFNSYPEKFSTGDIDLNETDEILVSGTGFDGLSILTRSGRDLGEYKIISETSFSEAIFIDLNADGYPDVLAFDILENSLQFYFNNTIGDFRLERSIRFPEKINFLQTADLDRDGFKDIVYSFNNSIEILYGDFQSSYDKKNTISLDGTASRIQFGDFNKDEIPDIAYLVQQENLIINFGKGGGEFYEGITYLNGFPISSITKFKYRNSESIACLFESGEIKYITTLNEFGSDLKIVPSIKTGAVKKFDYLNDEVPDISFIDEYDNSLKLFLNDNKGIPTVYYSWYLVDSQKEIVVDEFFKRRKIFYCYTKGSPLVEVFRYNFYTNKLYRKQLYAPGEILDIALQRVDSTFVNVFLTYIKESKLYLGKFENRDLSVTFREYPFIDRNVFLAKLFIKEDPQIYYWKTEGTVYQFKSAEVKSGPNIYKNYHEVLKSDSLNIQQFGADSYNNEYPSLVSLIQSKTASYSVVMSGDNINISNKLFDSPSKSLKKFNRGFFGETTIKGIINFTINSSNDASIYRLVFSQKEKKFTLTHMLDADNVSDYFFARLDRKNYYLVYSNKEGELSITSVKK